MKNLFSKIRTNLRAVLGAILIIFIVAGFYYWQIRTGRIFIDDSQISASIITIAPTTSGRLFEVEAQEGKFVKKGDVLAVVGSETIRSTTDGLVVMANNQIGGSFTPQNSVAQIIDQSQMRVVGTIDENKGLNKLNVGQVASFTVDAFPGKTFWGFVDEVSPTAKQTQLSFSISSERPIQQFQVYVRFPVDKYPQLKNGMSAKLTIFTDTN
jgi:multidrug resistance efflux pump